VRSVRIASVANVFALLTRNFKTGPCISLIITQLPLGWLLMSQWLQDYTYVIKITWDVFVMAGFCGYISTLITICWQALKATVANPVKRV